MKVAITADEPLFEAQLEPRFGRCAIFVIVDSETREWKPIQNPAAEAMGGAGTQAAQFLADQGVEAVISGDFGPNAYIVLDAANIRMYKSEVNQISSLFEKYLTDQLEQVSEPTRPEGRRGRGFSGRRRQ